MGNPFEVMQGGVDVTQAAGQSRNQPARLQWFRDLGLGLFIHWTVDSQLGMVISHSLVGASSDYVERYFNDLPKTFNPSRFDPDEWARLAKVTGFRYVVFTTKHHNGFCMFDTRTTDYSVMNTPYGRDITRQVVDAFRAQGLGIGFYFSPDDFSVLHRQGIEIQRGRAEVDPVNNPGLMEINKAQVRELLSNYGPIDMIFFDGQAEGLKQLAWQVQPAIVVTRGDIATPEQHIPGQPPAGPWESCITMGTAWQYQPTNEPYKSGSQLIQMLIETRAKGGNLLLNVGPKPDGQLPEEQAGRLMELGLWTFVNQEAVYDVVACPVMQEGDIWYTRSQHGDTVYAAIANLDWSKGVETVVGHGFAAGNRTYGKRLSFDLRHVSTTADSRIEVLGQSGTVLEYNDSVDPRPVWRQDDQGLHVTIISAQRIYDAWTWNNPIVLKITHAEVRA